MEFEICLPFVKIDDFFMLRAEALFLPWLKTNTDNCNKATFSWKHSVISWYLLKATSYTGHATFQETHLSLKTGSVQVPVAHICNPSYSWRQTSGGLKPVPGK
jgi:hypothetical protein